MPRYSRISKERLSTCDQRLQDLFNEVIKHVDCSISEGHRSKERQNKLYDEKRSKLRYPRGRHNSNPSKAVDATPYPVDYEDRERQTLFAGFVIGIGRSMGYNIRWGGNWDMYEENGRWEVEDNNFDDMPHFEIRE